MALELKMGDLLRLKKPHLCGGSVWAVTRLVAVSGMKSRACGRYVLLAGNALALAM